MMSEWAIKIRELSSNQVLFNLKQLWENEQKHLYVGCLGAYIRRGLYWLILDRYEWSGNFEDLFGSLSNFETFGNDAQIEATDVE